MSDDVQYRYDPKVPGAFLLGVPARDLTAADVEALEPRAREDLEGSEHYVKAKFGTQADPDPRTPGRTDSDTMTANPGGPAVPLTDEPVFEQAPSFTQADTAPSNTQVGTKDKGK